MRTTLLIAAATLLAAPAALVAQQHAAADTAAAPAKAAPQISDNSFLVEEAYNQEEGVVQHIAGARRTPDGTWGMGFTQEWPFESQRHQLSYTVPVISAAGPGTGIGDVMLNYRYQLLGHDEERVWIAPRLSLALPTGSVRDGRGAGGPGLQVNLPLSVAVSDKLVTHWNAGGTITRARALSGVQDTPHQLTAAASAIWLLAPTFNLMLETSWDRTETLDAAGTRQSADHFVILPGVRTAINLASGMQIVPGIGIPIGAGPSRGERDLFLYLSVEHPFK